MDFGHSLKLCQSNAMRCRLRASGVFQDQMCSMARIRHLAILTEDVQRLVKFYTNSFGLKIVQGVGTATYLTDGHINLAIIPIGPEREIEGNQLKEGINHFGFAQLASNTTAAPRTHRAAISMSRSRISTFLSIPIYLWRRPCPSIVTTASIRPPTREQVAA